jgi:hypothetical protein
VRLEIMTEGRVVVNDGASVTLRVQAYDAAGRTVAGTNIAWTMDDPDIATVSANGILTGQRPGRTRVVARAGELTSGADVEIKAVATATALAGAATLSGHAGEPFPDPLRVRLTDRHGGGVRGQQVLFSVHTGRGSLSAAAVQTDSAGYASVVFLPDTTIGTTTVRASAVGQPAEFRLKTAPGPVARLSVVAPLQVAPGAEVNVQVVAGDRFGNTVAAPPAELVEEARWIEDRPVLDTAGLGAGRVVALAAGHVDLQARSEGVTSAVVRLTVRPAGPTIVGFSGSAAVSQGDTLTVRGYLLDEVAAAAVSVDGHAAGIVSRDSATLRILQPTAATADCTGAGRGRLRIAGTTTAIDLTFRRSRVAEVGLAVGEAVRITAAQQHCLQLVPENGASYVLAFVDRRAIDRSAGGAEPRFSYPDLKAQDFPAFYEFSVQDRARDELLQVAGMQATHLPRDAGHPQPDYVLLDASAVSTADFRGRTTPWAAGDRELVNWYWNVSYDLLPATILRVYAGRFAVAVLDRDLPTMHPSWVASLDTAMNDFIRVVEPFYQSAFWSGQPTTSGSGQLLMVLGAGSGSFAFNENLSNWLQLGAGSLAIAPHSGLRYTLLHELAHTWQFRYMQQRVGGSPWQFTNWAMEGGADLATLEGLRLLVHQDLFGNLPQVNALAGYGFREPSSFQQAPTGVPRGGEVVVNFNVGYSASEWFLRDLIVRLMDEGGHDHTAAAREVSRGALDGWYGHSAPERNGLEQRLRQRLDPTWEPVEALLEAVARVALDDTNAGSRWQVPYVQRAWERFPPAGDLLAGRGAAHTRFAGDATALGYFRITADSRGGSYRMSAAVPGIEWLLVRER